MKSVVCGSLVLFAIIIFGVFCVSPVVCGSSNVTDLLTIVGNNVAVTSVSINNNAASIILTPATTTNVNVNASVFDVNGCAAITGGTTTILLYRSGITSSTCITATNPLNCYIAAAFTASSTCSGGNINMTTTFPVQYYAQATDASSSFSTQNWMATVVFTDPSSSTGSADSTSATGTNEMATLVALSIPTSTLNYGNLNASSTTSSTNQTVNILDGGNSNISVSVNGTALTSGGNSVATSSQHYATSVFTYGGGESLLSDTATTISGMTINASGTTGGGSGGFSANWTKTQNLPYTNQAHAATYFNGYVYMLGGTPLSDTSTVLFAKVNATGSLGAWTSTQALPYAESLFSATAYNGYIYVAGGFAANAAITSTVIFAPINSTGSLGSWTKTQTLPGAVDFNPSLAYNGYLYSIGGRTLSGASTSSVFFAPINSTGSLGNWSITHGLPDPLYRHSSVVYNGYLYTLAGTSDGINFTSTVTFAAINSTGSVGAWTSTQALPYTLGSHEAVSNNGFVYAIAGDVNAVPTATVLFAPITATGSLGAWSSTFSLPATLDTFAVAAGGGYVYSIGGMGDAFVTSTVDFAQFNTTGAASVSTTYWGWGVPNGTPNGTYSGTLTFTAAFSQ